MSAKSKNKQKNEVVNEVVSDFYGMPIEQKFVEATTENLANLGEDDLVKAHLSRNYSYFGAIDKTLSGFYILNDEDDNYYLYDARDTGQIYFQDHETRDVYVEFDSLDKYVGYFDELEEARKKKDYDRGEILGRWSGDVKEKASSRAVSTHLLADRYQWLVWFLAQPMEKDGKMLQNDVDLVNPAIGKYRYIWPKANAAKELYDKEKPTLAADVHLAIYWLLHFLCIADMDMVADIISAANTLDNKLFETFKNKFAKFGTEETLVDILPDFKRRRSLLVYYLALLEKDKTFDRMHLSLVMDPDYFGLVKIRSISDRYKLDESEIKSLELSTSKMPGKLPAVILAKAFIDLWRDKKESANATDFAKLCLNQVDTWETWAALVNGFLPTNGLVTDPKIRAAAAQKLLEYDPYHYSLLDILHKALGESHDPKAAEVQILFDRIGEIRPIYMECRNGKDKAAALKKASELPDDKRRLFAERILFSAEDPGLEKTVIEKCLGWIVELGSPYRALLLKRGLGAFSLDVEKIIKGLRKIAPAPDGKLSADLRSLISQKPKSDNIVDEMDQETLVKALLAWLNHGKGAGAAEFDTLLDQLESSKDPKVKESIINSAFNPFEKEAYILPKFSDEQAARAAKILIDLNRDKKKKDIHVYNAAGHQLFRFNHKGAEDILIKSLGIERDEEVVANLYSAVRNMNTERSRLALAKRLFTEKRWFWRMANAIKEIYSEDLHKQIIKTIDDAKDVDAASHYMFTLSEFLEKTPPMVDLLEKVLAWPAKDDPKLKYILIEGMKAALEEKRFDLVKAAHERIQAIKGEPVSDYHKIDGKFAYENPFDDPKLKKELENALK